MLQNTDHYIIISSSTTHMHPITITVTNAINHLRSMVQSHAHTNDILVCIDSLQSQLKSIAKHQNDLLSQLTQIRAENKRIKHKSKALGKTMGDMEKNQQNLKQQLHIRNAICRKKSEQLLSVSDWTTNKDSKNSHAQIEQINEGIQCQILNWQLVRDLEQENSQLRIKFSHLQRLHEEECNQNNAKQLHMEQLLLQKEMKKEESLMNPQSAEQLAKEQDNSTVDADQLQDDDYQLPTQLQKTDSRDTEDSDSPPQQIQQVDSIQESKSSWLDTLWHKSMQLCSLVLRK